MNEHEQGVMTIVTIARIVESTLWYCLRPRDTAGFSKSEHDNRFKALTALTQEGSPFALNCDNNGENGKNLKEEMQYFIEDVYGDPGRIVTTNLDGTLRVEQSLSVELFDTIVKLRGYLEAFLHAGMRALEEANALEPDFKALIEEDILYFHSFAGKISCMLLADKFLELNQSANTYAQSYAKSHDLRDPRQDPEFNVKNDPSFRMLENEFHQINQDMVAVLNSYNDNEDFKYARQQVYSDCEIFSGKKQTTDLAAFFRVFSSYFDKILNVSERKLNNMFYEISKTVKSEQKEEA